jgi:hypothetical protein
MSTLPCITFPIGYEVEQRLRRCCSDGVSFMRFSYPQIILFKGLHLTPQNVATILKIAVLAYMHNAQQNVVQSKNQFFELMDQFTDILVPNNEFASTVKAYCELSKRYQEDNLIE